MPEVPGGNQPRFSRNPMVPARDQEDQETLPNV